jgi:hypothetical protein
VAVFSTPSNSTTDALHVVFERDRPEVGDLRLLAAAELVEFPTIHFHVANALPRNDRGKLQRFVLKQATLAV